MQSDVDGSGELDFEEFRELVRVELRLSIGACVRAVRACVCACVREHCAVLCEVVVGPACLHVAGLCVPACPSLPVSPLAGHGHARTHARMRTSAYPHAPRNARSLARPPKDGLSDADLVKLFIHLAGSLHEHVTGDVFQAFLDQDAENVPLLRE